jgi:hypothetical protein
VGDLARSTDIAFAGVANLGRSREAEAFLDALQHSAPEAVSACAGWTCHDVTAHLTAAAAEVTRHLEPHLRGDKVPKTATFEEREPPYRAMDDAILRPRPRKRRCGPQSNSC